MPFELQKEIVEIPMRESEAVEVASTVNINDMADVIMQGLTEFAELATDDMKEAVKHASPLHILLRYAVKRSSESFYAEMEV